MKKERIGRWRKILDETWDRDTWKEDMKREARKFKRGLLYFSTTYDDSKE